MNSPYFAMNNVCFLHLSFLALTKTNISNVLMSMEFDVCEILMVLLNMTNIWLIGIQTKPPDGGLITQKNFQNNLTDPLEANRVLLGTEFQTLMTISLFALEI